MGNNMALLIMQQSKVKKIMIGPYAAREKSSYPFQYQCREPLVDSLKSVLRYVESGAARAKAGNNPNDASAPVRKLFDDLASERVLLKIAFKKVPEKRHRINLPLPHPFVDVNAVSACLIVKDFREGEYDYTTASDETLHVLRKEGVVAVKRVIPVSQLRAEFKQYKSRRELASQHDIFLADRAVYKFLPSFMGKVFFKLKKFPREVDLHADGTNNKAIIEKALQSGHLVINNRGNECAMSIGACSQTPEEIAENILHALKQLVRNPGLAATENGSTIDNIRSAHFQIKDVAVPVFFSPGRDLVGQQVTNAAANGDLIAKPKNVGFATEPQEVDTVVSGKVEVLPDGDIRIIPHELGEGDVENEEDTDEKKKSKKQNNKRKASEAKLPENNDVDMSAAGSAKAGGAKKKKNKNKKRKLAAEALPKSDTNGNGTVGSTAAGKKKKNRNKNKNLAANGVTPMEGVVSNGKPKTAKANQPEQSQAKTDKNASSPQKPQPAGAAAVAAGGLSKSAKKRLKQKKGKLAAASNTSSVEMPQA